MEPLCVVQPSTWPADLQEWGRKVAKTIPLVDLIPAPPSGYFGKSDTSGYYLQKAVEAARRYWN
jgi:hypothetical protein